MLMRRYNQYMKSLRYYFISLIILIFAITLPGCSNSGEAPPGLIIYLEDAPAEYKAVDITLSSVQLFDGTQWVETTVFKGNIQLLTLTGGAMMKIVAQNVDQGRYTKLRVVFSTEGNSIDDGLKKSMLSITEDNRYHEFDIDLNAVRGSETILMLDIDAAASISGTSADGYSLTPVIKLIDLSSVGSVWGTLSTDKGAAILQRIYVKVLTKDGKYVASSYSNTNTGNIFFRLSPGIYDIAIIPPLGVAYQGDTLRDIQIEALTPVMLNAIKLTEITTPVK